MIYRFLLILIGIMTLAISNIAAANAPNPLTISIEKAALHQSGISQYPLLTIQGSHVRMVSFTTYDGYKVTDKKLDATMWVTVEPELKQKCTDYVRKHPSISHEQLTLWMAELLGLSTKQINTRRLVVMDVPVIQAYYGSSPKNMGIFRPCTDPRIGPHADGSAICPEQMNPQDVNISSAYKTWFINNSFTSFTLKNGKLWTEYGYTYNWNPRAKNVYGLSEFVILKDTPMTIIPNPNDMSSAYVTPEDYCV